MAAVSDVKLNYAVPSIGKHIVEVVYDFAADAGAVGVLDLVQFQEAVIITDMWAQVLTACTSGGSATLDVGVVGADTDAFQAATAVAALTLNSTHSSAAAGADEYIAADGKIAMEIKVAALTAGKIKYFFEVVQAG